MKEKNLFSQCVAMLNDLSANTYTFIGISESSEDKNPVINYVSMGDSSKFTRDEWAERLPTILKYYQFSHESISPISRLEHDFDAIMVGGDDIVRSVNFIKYNFSYLNSKAKFALLKNSDPQKRAKLLNAGFDAVFDIDRCPPEEAISQISSILQRYNKSIPQTTCEDEACSFFLESARISNREKKLISLLYKRKGQIVSYSYIQYFLSDWSNGITSNNLKVIISNLRKKLKPSVTIVSHTNVGYEMKS